VIDDAKGGELKGRGKHLDLLLEEGFFLNQETEDTKNNRRKSESRISH